MNPKHLNALGHFSYMIFSHTQISLTLRETAAVAKDLAVNTHSDSDTVVADLLEGRDWDTFENLETYDDVLEGIRRSDILQSVADYYIAAIPDDKLAKKLLASSKQFIWGRDLLSVEQVRIFLSSIRPANPEPKVLNIYKMDLAQIDGIYCGRPSIYGNLYGTKEFGRGNAVVLHQDYLQKHPKYVEDIKPDLEGQNLVCFCKPKACHCDNLLTVCNTPKTENRLSKLVVAEKLIESKPTRSLIDKIVEDTIGNDDTFWRWIRELQDQVKKLDFYSKPSEKTEKVNQAPPKASLGYEGLQYEQGAWHYTGNEVVKECLRRLHDTPSGIPKQESYMPRVWEEFQAMAGQRAATQLASPKPCDPAQTQQGGYLVDITESLPKNYIYLPHDNSVAVKTADLVWSIQPHAAGSKERYEALCQILPNKLHQTQHPLSIIVDCEKLRKTFPNGCIWITYTPSEMTDSNVSIVKAVCGDLAVPNSKQLQAYTFSVTWELWKPHQHNADFLADHGLYQACQAIADWIAIVTEYAAISPEGTLMEIGVPARLNLGKCTADMTNCEISEF